MYNEYIQELKNQIKLINKQDKVIELQKKLIHDQEKLINKLKKNIKHHRHPKRFVLNYKKYAQKFLIN